MDQFLRPPKSQSRWYGIHPAEPKDPTRPGKYVNTWPNDAAKINSAFPRIAKQSVANSQPVFRDSNRRSQNFKVTCKLLCCQSCTFCNKKCKAAAKERLKSSLRNQRNKFCELCFFCRSLCFCPKCDKCPQCCSCPTSRRAPSVLLADLDPPGCKSESSVHFEGWLHSPIQNQTSSGERSLDSQWLCKPPQEPLPEGGFGGLTAKGGSRDGEGSYISSLHQPIVYKFQNQTKNGDQSWTSVL